MKEELIFCPLGGSGEIGMNMNLFAYGKPENQKWIIVDIGVTFADDTIPGIDLIYPDPGFIIDKKEDLLGIILTHAHEDHIGSLTHLFEYIEAPIYCGKFTALIAKSKISKGGGNSKLVKIVDHYPKMIKVGPFNVGFVIYLILYQKHLV